MAKKIRPPFNEVALVLRPSGALDELRGLFDPSLVEGSTSSEGGGVAPFLSLEEGVISDGQTEVGSELDFVILGVAVQHALFPTAYQAGKRDDPICFYVGTNERNARPDPKSPQPQSATGCPTCIKNAFGSSPIPGRSGKACAEHRRLLILPLGERDDPSTVPMRRLKIPATSLKHIDAYVKKVEGFRPLQSVVTHLQLVKSEKNRFETIFTPLRLIDDRASLEAIARRAEEGKSELFSTWNPKAREGVVEAKSGRRVVKR